MVSKKHLESGTGSALAATPVDMPATLDDASPPPLAPEPARPLSGGSFVRQADGTLIRNQEA